MSDEPAPTRSSGRPRVAVVFGGRSAEHAISCITAASVLAAIDRDVYDVVPVGITTDGRWVLGVDDPSALQVTNGKLPEVESGGAGGNTVVIEEKRPTQRAQPVGKARAKKTGGKKR